MIQKSVVLSVAGMLLIISTCLVVANSFAATNSITITVNEKTITEKIQQLNDRLGELSLQIRIANSNKEREKVAELRDEREQVQQELRDLRRLYREEKAVADKLAKREAAERKWATYAPEKQLCAAIEYHRADLVEKVVESGQIDLSKPNDHCFFPLGDAAARGHVDIVENLLQKKSPLVMRMPHFNRLISAMDAAASSKHDRTAVLELLKQSGGTLNDSREDSSPGSVVKEGDDAAKKILKEKYNVEAGQLTFGSTFVRALENGHLNNIRWLLKEGADPNESVLGRTALMVAVESNDIEKVSLLIQAGADINQRGINHTSVLAHAEKRRERVNGQKKAEMDDIIRYLKNRGATHSEKES